MSKSNLAEHLSWLLSTRPFIPSRPASNVPDHRIVEALTKVEDTQQEDVASLPQTPHLSRDQAQSDVVRRLADNVVASPPLLANDEGAMARLQVAPKSASKSRLVQFASQPTGETWSGATTLCDRYSAQFQDGSIGMWISYYGLEGTSTDEVFLSTFCPWHIGLGRSARGRNVSLTLYSPVPKAS